jgi:hypothetical protein
MTTENDLFPALIDFPAARTALDAIEALPPGTRAQTGRWLMIQLEAVEREAVEEMRKTGASWAQVGQALGTTRQNAQQLYGS